MRRPAPPPVHLEAGAKTRAAHAVYPGPAACGTGTMKLKSKADTGGVLEVGGELHSTVANQVWSLKLVDNTVTVWKGTRTTLAPTDSLAVGRVIPNLAGADKITLRAVSGTKVCSVSLIS